MQLNTSLVNMIKTIGGDQERLNSWEGLSDHFSLIPLKRNTKVPFENNWTQWCNVKRKFNKKDFIGRNCGIACGPASGVIVLDIDDHDAFKIWLADHSYALPDTLTIQSGGKSTHHYFEYVDTYGDLGNRSVQGVFDVRGIGGQVVAPGSVHPGTSRMYSIIANHPITAPPDWLLAMCLNKPMAISAQPSIVTPVGIPPQQGKVILDALPVSARIKEIISTSYPKNERSEPGFFAIIKLLAAGISESTIFEIFQDYPIGEKYRDKGQSKDKWLAGEIDRAKSKALSDQTTPPVVPIVDDLQVWTGTDFLQSQLELEFLVDEIWPKGESLLLLGSSGVGKSLFTLDIAFSLAGVSPGKYLNKFDVHGEHKILFIQSENSKRGMITRVKKMMACPGSQLANLNNIMAPKENNDCRLFGDIMDKQFYDKFDRYINKFQPSVIVVDPLISYHGNNENENSEMRKSLDKFSRICIKYGLSMLLVHHSGKVDSKMNARGASAICDWAENIVELKKDNGNFKLIHAKARNTPQIDTLDLTRNSFLKLEILNMQPVHSAEVLKALTALQSLGGNAGSQQILIDQILVLESNSLSENTARNWINKAVFENIIIENRINARSKSYSCTI